jgi:hypothetical protein
MGPRQILGQLLALPPGWGRNDDRVVLTVDNDNDNDNDIEFDGSHLVFGHPKNAAIAASISRGDGQLRGEGPQ